MIDLIRKHAGPGEAIVDCDTGERLSYQALITRVDDIGRELSRRQVRGIVFLLAANTIDFVMLYLGCLRAALPVFLADPKSPLESLLEVYRPSMILAPAPSVFWGYDARGTIACAPNYCVWQGGESYPVHAELSVLLPTSGSTGNPKLVRLKEGNLRSNATAIAEYLNLGPGERAIQSLPLYYSYGLSVLNSHLVSGGTVVLTPHSFLRPEFWGVVDCERCTSFAGIPYMYEVLHRLRFNPAKHPSLKVLTQAGGGLVRELIAHFHEQATQAGKQFVVMYGQTEATARISYVPPEKLDTKIGSIGIPIPMGTLSLREAPGMEDSRELVYEGPNVMMGYAESSEDLALGDVQKGMLTTGDLAIKDEDGYFWIVGRLNRFAKLFGRRISLEDIERRLEVEFKIPVAVLEGKNELRVFLEAQGGHVSEAIVGFLSRTMNVPPNAIQTCQMEALPRTGNGKKNYSALGTRPC